MSQAVRVALRRLRDTPVFTAIVLASLAFAMGLNILVFGFTSPVLFKALPYPEPDRLLDVSMAPPDVRPLTAAADTGGAVRLSVWQPGTIPTTSDSIRSSWSRTS